jgi:hypothetical protein
MVAVTTKHTTTEALEVAASEASNRVNGVDVCNRRLIARQSVLGGQNINTDKRTSDIGEGGDIICNRRGKDRVGERRQDSISSSEGWGRLLA